MRPEAFQRIAQAAAEVVVKRRLGARDIVVGDRLVQQRRVAGLFQVGGHCEHEPQGVVVEARADRVVPALGERLVLVVGTARWQLRAGDVDDPLACPPGDQVDKAQQVLGRVPEAHAAPDARLVARCRTAHVEGDHALVGVPGIDHPVCLGVRGRDRQFGEHPVPVIAQAGEALLDRRRLQPVLDHGPHTGLVHRLAPRRVKLGVLGFSQYPRRKMTSLRSPGASVERTWCEPQGDQPWATEPAEVPRSTTRGLSKPR